MIRVSSSNIAGYEYLPDTRVLRIQFNSGRTYSYKDVPENIVDEFESADSKGKFVHDNIKNNYSLA